MKKKKNESKKKMSLSKILTLIGFFLNKLFLKILIILSLCAALFFGGKFGWQKLGEIKTEKSSAVVFRELQKWAELVTAKNTYSDIISIKKTRIAGFAKSFSIIKYSGVIRGGIKDISQSQVTIYDRGKKVKVLLPKMEILSNDISSIEVFDESKSIFVSISVKEIMEEIRFNQESASAEILETGFLEEAKAHAKEITETILLASGFEEVSVIFNE